MGKGLLKALQILSDNELLKLKPWGSQCFIVALPTLQFRIIFCEAAQKVDHHLRFAFLLALASLTRAHFYPVLLQCIAELATLQAVP